MRYCCLLLLLLCSVWSNAQNVDFLGADFNSADSWRQERENFVTNDDGFLTDTSSIYDTDIISREIDGLVPENGDIRLRFQVRCNYDNSSVNNFHIYILANGNDPLDPDFRGFAIATGHKPNYKTYSLIYNNGGEIEVLANTDITITKKNPSLDVVRTANGMWYVNSRNIYSEPAGRFHLANTFVTTFSFTKTGARNFEIKFEEFSQTQNSNPQKSSVDSVKLLSPNTLRVFHNARLDEAVVADVRHYSMNGIHPESVDCRFWYSDIRFREMIPSGIPLDVRISGLADIWGNAVEPYSQILYQAGREDVVINEIMVDLSPAPFALPKNKYVEIFNASAQDLRLDGYRFYINDLEYELPDIIFPSGEYMILCANDTAFAKYGLYANILQESKLTVSDKTLILTNKTGAVVDSVTYSQKLYHDPTRQDGGYSIERRDPRNSCSGMENWHASTDLSGGTPGRKNSQFQVYVDNTIPVVVSYKTLSPNEFRIEFSEALWEAQVWLNGGLAESIVLAENTVTANFAHPMRKGANILMAQATDLCRTDGLTDTLSIDYEPFEVVSAYAVSSYQLIMTFSNDLDNVQTDNFVLSDGQIPILCEFTSDGRRNIMLTFADDFASDRKYSITILNLRNSISEAIHDTRISFRYHALAYGDLLINEVMYYPNVGEKRYVEVYNNSGSDVFLYGLTLRHHNAALDATKSAMSQSHSILRDGEYAVLAADTASVSSVYGAPSEALAYCPGLPALNTGKGYVVLVSADGEVLDSMYYEKSMHSTILQSVRGVALERVSVGEESLVTENWQSAQAEYGYATPGFRNSVSLVPDDDEIDEPLPELPSGEAVHMENQLIRPGDMDRAMCISLNFRRMNVCVSASIFDDNGRPRRSLITQEMVYPGYEILWDARDDHGSFCKMGIYIVLIKAWDPTGWTKTYKLACVVGSGR